MSEAGRAALDQYISQIREFPNLGKTAAPRVAKTLEAGISASVGAGAAPDGSPWQPTLKGDKPQLGSKIDYVVAGSTITIRLRGKSFLHHTGRARGHIVRRVIPTESLPASLSAAVAKELAAVMGEHAGAIKCSD